MTKPRTYRFAVIVRFEGELEANRREPLVWWHNSPREAARRLTAALNANYTVRGTRFYIVDHDARVSPSQYSLREFEARFCPGRNAKRRT